MFEDEHLVETRFIGLGTDGTGTTGTDGTGTTGTRTTGTGTTTNPSLRGTSDVRGDRGGSDWGWLGLLGLAGLAGLARKREKPKVYADPNQVTGSGSSTRY